MSVPDYAPKKWLRVSKRNPCSVCGKWDWCCVSADGVLILCMRVESDKPSKGEAGGWLHRPETPKTDVRPVYRAPEPKLPPPPCAAMLAVWRKDCDQFNIGYLAFYLGVTEASLDALGCVWNGHQFAFPMKTGDGKIVGIRIRSINGDQWAIKGSRAGLFIPDLNEYPDLTTTFVCEGASDVAAVLTMGMPAIGRPSCLGNEGDVATFCQIQGVQKVVIVADADKPGLRGAEKLQSALPVDSVVYCPPMKDVREMLNVGGDIRMILQAVKDLEWKRVSATQRNCNVVNRIAKR